MALEIGYYDGNSREWDDFMLRSSRNGTFLQTRQFIDYHQNQRFVDRSLCIRSGQELAAAVFGCEWQDEEGRRVFYGHRGTTYGGITVSDQIYTATRTNELFETMEAFLRTEGFDRVYLRMVPTLYQRRNTDLLDYFLYKNGYTCFSELNYYLPLERYRQDPLSQFSSGKRRDYRYSLKNGLTFRKLETEEEIAAFYQVLLKNHEKLGVPTIHSLPELQDLVLRRFPDRIYGYGVYLGETMIAGSVIFRFGERVWHTQYLASDEDYLKLYPMDFLIANLIFSALEAGMDLFTFGICTEDQGRYLNLGLSRFKEGFGTEFGINRSYEKLL